MKIAFTSCMDARTKSKQGVWTSIAKNNPNVLLLLGDSIYMDYIYGMFFNKPRNWSEKKFADELYRRYLLQSNVNEFRDLLSRVSLVESIWDDHDFAWNNSYVLGGGKKAVSLNIRLISKSLRKQFIDWVQAGAENSYPDQPSMIQLLDQSDTGIEKINYVDQVQIILLDTRYYRTRRNRQRSSSLLGNVQREWLLESLKSWRGKSLVCSSTTIRGAKESWDRYYDYQWLLENVPNGTVFLSGDIHKNKIQTISTAKGQVFDISASGAARSWGALKWPNFDASGNYGIVELEGDQFRASCMSYDLVEHSRLV